MVSFLHTADIHVGAKFKGLGSEKGNIRRKDIRTTLRSIVGYVLEKDMDGLLIVGDLFDERVIDTETVSTVDSILSELGSHDKWCVIVPGNHDPLGDKSPYNETNFSQDIQIVKNTKGFDRIELPGLIIYATAFDEQHRDVPKLRTFIQEKAEDVPTLIAIHGSVEPGNDFWSNNAEGSQYCPVSSDDITKLNVDYVALGHFHSYRQISSDPVAIYPGSPEGLGYDEPGQRYVAAVTIDPSGAVVEQIPVGQKVYVNLPESIEEWDPSKITSELEKNKGANKLLRWKLKGWAKDGMLIDVEKIMQGFEDQYFDLRIYSDLILPDDLVIGSDYSAPSIFKRKITNAIKECEDPVEKKRLTDAYMLGVNLFGGGKL